MKIKYYSSTSVEHYEYKLIFFENWSNLRLYTIIYMYAQIINNKTSFLLLKK